jgi:hypothetical protein
MSAINNYSVVEPEAPSETLVSPPHNVEAEEAIIGAVFIDPSVFPGLLAILQPQDFYIHRNRFIWEALIKLQTKEVPFDFLTIKTELERVGKLGEVGGEARLTGLLNATPTSLHADTYAILVKDQALKRLVLKIANQIAVSVYSNNLQLFQIIEQALVDLEKIKPINIGVEKTRWTMAELIETEFPDVGGPIPKLIPNGLTILGGRPKRGKSWLMLQATCTLAIGGKFFGEDLKVSRVLYYALEDPPRRLKERTLKLEIDSSALIEFAQRIKPLHLGGISEIEEEAKEYQMIVIDTIRRAMPGKDFTKDGPLFDNILGKLQTISQANNMAIVVILHTRKSSPGFDPDPVDDVLGSTGLTASADCVLALYKNSNTSGTRLLGRQRDGADIDLKISFYPITCTWHLLGDSDSLRVTEEENSIMETLKDLGKAKVGKIAQAVGKDRSNTSRRCSSLLKKGLLQREIIESVEYYYLPTQPTQDTLPV